MLSFQVPNSRNTYHDLCEQRRLRSQSKLNAFRWTKWPGSPGTARNGGMVASLTDCDSAPSI